MLPVSHYGTLAACNRNTLSTPHSLGPSPHGDSSMPFRTGDITSKLVYDRLYADCQAVLEKLVPVQKEVVAKDGKWLDLIIMP
jgi:hypothetical protein